MLAPSGRLPTSGDYVYEVKWDGFRAIVSTEVQRRLRGRRGWDMTPYVGFLVEPEPTENPPPRSSRSVASSDRRRPDLGALSLAS
jgi:hypothetical protein